MAKITVYHLYPDHLNLHGDRGNMIALCRRAAWRGIDLNLLPIQPGERINFDACDLLFMGGGGEQEQEIVIAGLEGSLDQLTKAIKRGMVVLAVDGSYQLLGRYYTTAQGKRRPGLNLLDLYTAAGPRKAGDIALLSGLWDPPRTLVGFENHTGCTFLGPSVKPLGKVLSGFGNNGRDKTEGVIYRNVIGTYLHGALLPKNPWLTDYLLQKALEDRGHGERLPALDDQWEEEAHRAALQKCKSR